MSLRIGVKCDIVSEPTGSTSELFDSNRS